MIEKMKEEQRKQETKTGISKSHIACTNERREKGMTGGKVEWGVPIYIHTCMCVGGCDILSSVIYWKEAFIICFIIIPNGI